MKNRPQEQPKGDKKLTRYHLDSQKALPLWRFYGRTRDGPTYRPTSSKTMFPAPYRARSQLPGLSDRLDGRYSSLHSFCMEPIISKNTKVCQQKCFEALACPRNPVNCCLQTMPADNPARSVGGNRYAALRPVSFRYTKRNVMIDVVHVRKTLHSGIRTGELVPPEGTHALPYL